MQMFDSAVQADSVWFVKWSCLHRGKRYSVVGLGLTREVADAAAKQKAVAFWQERKAQGDKPTAYSSGWDVSAARL
jgi:hypothetical protein